MKKFLLLIAITSLLLFACGKKEAAVEETPVAEETPVVEKVVSMNFTVQGQGEVAKKLIEEAVMNVQGVTAANWDMDKKTIKISGTNEVVWEEVHKAIAAAGFDTTEMKASDEAYEALPDEAKYRKEITKKNANLKEKESNTNTKGNRIKAKRQKAD
jgi:copper chaperone CopZ